MKKEIINRIIRKFGVEIHGLGYLEKLTKSSFKNDPFEQQANILKNSKCELIFDIGANGGGITQVYHKLFPKAKIHSFEPIPGLAENFEKLHGKNEHVIFNKLALTNKIGEEVFNINKVLDTSSFLESTKIGATSDAQCKTIEQIRVQTNTLDNYCKVNNIREIDILKIDTQGSELNILKGSESLLEQQKIKLIFCEIYFKEQYVNQPLFYDIALYLKKFGYELQDIYEANYNAKQILWGDAIFLSKSLI